jgi:hypothetical protein
VKSDPVAILGCGPSGLLAAWAANLAKRPFAIFSKVKKSPLGGAQFLKAMVPGLTEEKSGVVTTYRMIGDPRKYYEKAYGDGSSFLTNWWHEVNEQLSWNLSWHYDQLWWMFADGINEAEINHQWVEDHKDDFSLVVSTVPRRCICAPMAPHKFPATNIYIKQEAINPNLPDGEIWYDGTDDVSWYRQSRVFGQGGTEWGSLVKPPYEGIINGFKPVRTDCDCWPDVLKVGRYGAWDKSEHLHEVFREVYQALVD